MEKQGQGGQWLQQTSLIKNVFKKWFEKIIKSNRKILNLNWESLNKDWTMLSSFLDFEKFVPGWSTKIDWWDDSWKKFWVILKRKARWFLWWIVPGDETWIHHCDPENKRQFVEYCHKRSPAPKKFKTKPLMEKSSWLELWGCCAYWLPEKRFYSKLITLYWNPKKSQNMHYEERGRNRWCLASTRRCQASHQCRHKWCHCTFGVYSATTSSLQPRSCS